MRALVVGMMLFAGCYAPARAVTEFCPARVALMHDPAATPEPKAFPAVDSVTESAASKLMYTLDAQTPRTIVHASIIADTGDGWYGWREESVELSKTSVMVKTKLYSGTFTFARSNPLTVTFPKPLIVHHVWVTQARTNGETLMGWDPLGDFSCRVPDFADGGPGFTPVARRQASVTPSPAPSTSAPPGVAVAVAPPFPIDCEEPFKHAGVARPVTPEYPQGGNGGYYITFVEVAVGGDGRLLDAWTYAGSGNRAVDLSALRAARASAYESAISYCQRVPGYYLFRADFR